MSHPFQDKLLVLIGNPTRCSRQEVREALSKVGGVADERITTYTHYVVAFKGAENTKVFEKAKRHDEYGYVILLNEKQFFDVLEGKAKPPEKKTPPPKEDVIITPAKPEYEEEHKRSHERVEKYFVEKKRLKNMIKDGALQEKADPVVPDDETIDEAALV
jgi:hypothetical protein